MKKDVDVELTTVVELDRLHARAEADAERSRATGTLEPQSIDRFAILRVIARGGMGELYLGWDDRLDRKVAIKLVHAQRHSEQAEQRLLREAKVLGQLSHPNVVSVFEVGHFEGRVFVAMEFVEGVTLRRWLRRLELTGVARTQAILNCFAAAGRGLAAVHAAGLAHRDFKPDNVLVGADGRVRIVDFGLARSLHETCEKSGEFDGSLVRRERENESTARDADLLETPTLTEDGALLGTPRYIAPEQWLGRRGDALSDQFSFCVALYEALFGTQPFQASNLEELSRAVQSGRLRPMPRRAEVPPRVREALLRGLSTKPSDRFASMDALLDALLPTPSRRPKLLGALALTLLISAITLATASSILAHKQASSLTVDQSTFDNLQRELVAAEHLARAEAQIDALSEAGSFALADVVFRDFAELPDHAGTSALARGWLRQAERLEHRGQLDAELDAYAAAYVSSFPQHQQRALFGLARAFMRTRQWPHLVATLDALTGPQGGTEALDQQQLTLLRAMQVTAMSSRRDLLGAARVLGPTDELTRDDAILRAAMLELGRARVTEHELDGSNLVMAELAGLDLDGDRVGELLIAGADARSLTVLGSASAELRELGQLELDRHRAAITDVQTLTRDGQAYVAVRRDAVQYLYQLTRVGDQLRAQLLGKHEQDGPQAASWALADLDRDQALELYLGLQASRRLLGLELGEHRWLDPHPATNATNSVIYALEAADLDGDGNEELAVLAGEWSAYDLRIFAPQEGPDPRLRLLGRRKLGAVQSMATLPAADGRGQWLAVGVDDEYPSRRVFPAATPSGSPGLHLLAWDGAGIQTIESWSLPGPARVLAGDFDGNGLHDLALGLRSSDQWECVLMLQIHAGDFRPLPIRKLWPVGAIDLDHDGDHELLVLDADTARDHGRPRGRLYVLGSGSQQLPTLDDARVATRRVAGAPGGPPGCEAFLGGCFGSEPKPLHEPARVRDDSEAARVLRDTSGDPALRGAIARAENLASIGLTLRAANSLSALARVAEEQLAANVQVRAAELFESRGHRLEAAHLYARALALPGASSEPGAELALSSAASRRGSSESFGLLPSPTPLLVFAGPRRGSSESFGLLPSPTPLRRSILARAIDLYAQVHRFEPATELAAAALGWGEAPELAATHQRLRTLASEAPRLVFDFETPLDERWSVDPLAVRRRHGRLELNLGGAEQGVVARRELQWDGGRLALQVELEVDTLEWSSGISVELRPLGREHAGSEPLEVGVSSRGGGGIYRLQLRCTDGGQHEPGSHGLPFALPSAELPVDRRRFELSAEYVDGGIWCIADGEGLHVEAPLTGSFSPGRYELLVRGSSHAWPRAKASIERIVIVGAREVERPRTTVNARGRLGRELAEGRAESVLDQLASADSLSSRERALLRFVALDELGRWEQAELALAEALGLASVDATGECRRDPATAQMVGQLLRHQPERLAPILRGLCRPDDYFPLLLQVWATAIFQHPDDDAVARVLTTQTTGLERWLPADAADRLAALTLLRARARAWATRGAHGSARSELERAVELASTWLELSEPTDEAGRAPLAVELAMSRSDLAAQLFDRGEEQRANELLRLALLTSPTPEILADMLVIDERFAGVRERPIWRELVEPARAGRSF